jgi:hypothetical protein
MNGSPKKRVRRVERIMKSVIKQFRAPEKETFNGFMVCILFALFILYFVQFLVFRIILQLELKKGLFGV